MSNNPADDPTDSRYMARAKAQEVKKHGVPLVDKLLGNPDLIGKIGSMTAPLANWGNENSLNRKLMARVIGIHKDKKLPPFAARTFAAQFDSKRRAIDGEPSARVVFFASCYVNYNQPEIGTDTLLPDTRVKVVEECSGHDGTWAMKK